MSTDDHGAGTDERDQAPTVSTSANHPALRREQVVGRLADGIVVDGRPRPDATEELEQFISATHHTRPLMNG